MQKDKFNTLQFLSALYIDCTDTNRITPNYRSVGNSRIMQTAFTRPSSLIKIIIRGWETGHCPPEVFFLASPNFIQRLYAWEPLYLQDNGIHSKNSFVQGSNTKGTG